MTHADTFDAFEASAKSAGFTEVLKKDWQPSLALDTHTHPFDVQAQVVAGELWLTAAGKTLRRRWSHCLDCAATARRTIIGFAR